MTLSELQNLYTQNNLGQFVVYQDPARIGGQKYLYIPDSGYYAVDDASLSQLDQSSLIDAGSTLRDLGGGRTQAAFSDPISGKIVNGVSTQGRTLDQISSNVQNTIAMNKQVSDAAALNAAIASGDKATVERLSPGMTLWNGAFVNKSSIPSLEAQGATVQNGNVVGAPIKTTQPTSLASMGQTSPNSVYRDNQNNFFSVDAQGNKTPMNLEQFKQLGINADFVPAGQTVSLNQAVSGTSGGTSGAGTVVDQLKNYIDSLYNQGYVLNPNVQITPEKMAEFTRQAESEIDPYYKTQLKLAREQLLSTAGYTVDQINQFETDLEKQYGRSLKSYQGGEAEKGFALSGERKLGEQQLAEETQRQIQQNRQSSQQTLANQGRTFAQQFGGMFGEPLPQGPQIGAMPTVSAGSVNFDRSGGTSPFYTLSPDVYSGLTGEQEFGRRSAELARASELESGYRTQQTIPRTLNI